MQVLSCAYLYPEPTEEACWHDTARTCQRDMGHPWLWAPWRPSDYDPVASESLTHGVDTLYTH